MGREKTFLPVRRDEGEKGGNCPKKLMTKTLSATRGSPGALRMTLGLWGSSPKGERVCRVASLRAEQRWS